LPDTGPPSLAGFVFLGFVSPNQAQITYAPARRRLSSPIRVKSAREADSRN
jgi:hypothetical protein